MRGKIDVVRPIWDAVPRFYCQDMRIDNKIARDEPLIHLAGSFRFRYSANKLRPLGSLADERNRGDLAPLLVSEAQMERAVHPRLSGDGLVAIPRQG